MIKKNMLLILSIALIMGLSACTVNINVDGSESSKEETVNEQEVSKVEDATEDLEKTDPSVDNTEEQEVSGENKDLPPEKQNENTTNLTLEGAKEIFSESYPKVAIEIAKTEGNAYYIQGFDGSDICKMKIIASTGEIILNKRITTGRNGGYNK